MHEITITVTHVKAIDKIDQFSKGDFYARATIGKDTQSTAVVKQQTETKPDGNAVTCGIACGATDLYAFYIFGFDRPLAQAANTGGHNSLMLIFGQ